MDRIISAFQSTLPVKGATKPLTQTGQGWKVSIHAPSEGSDPTATVVLWIHGFQSTLPVKGATRALGDLGVQRGVSIHAPSEGSDYVETVQKRYPNVSIHAPSEGSDSIVY